MSESKYHGKMMNLAERYPDFMTDPGTRHTYRRGYRDARHAAAEIALEADRTIEELREENEQLRAALEKVEWQPSGAHFICLWCGGLKRYAGHKPDCARQAALAPKEREGEGDTAITDGHLFTFATGDELGIEYVRNGSRLGFVWGNEPSWFVVAPDGQSASGYLDARLDIDELRRALAAFSRWEGEAK
jgi:hypothetical protein